MSTIKSKKKIGLYFGSFNPIHIGHLIIANHFLEFSDLDEIWFVVSPHNPLKEKEELMNAELRLKMVEAAVSEHPKLKVSKVEFLLPQPSYTIYTLRHLQLKYPKHHFKLLIGSDSLKNIEQWKDYKKILSGFDIYVYKRRGYSLKDFSFKKNIKILKAPYIDISATYIRQLLKSKKSVKYLMPEKSRLILEKTISSFR